MPLEKSSDLFHLIKSLSPAEKRHFTTFASRRAEGDETNYLKLFNAIEQQEVYNEKEIIKKFGKDKFIKQLFRTKNYLYDLILTGLAAFHTSKSIAAELRKKMSHIDMLIAKGLYKQASKQLKLTKKKAAEHEMHDLVMMLNRSELYLLTLGVYPQNMSKHYNQLFEIEEDMLEKMSLESRFRIAMNKIGSLKKQIGNTRDKETTRRIDEITSQKLFSNEKFAATYQCKVFLYDMKSVAESAKGNYGQAYYNNQKLLKLLQGNPERMKEKPYDYVITMNNHLVFCRLLNQTNEILKGVRELRRFGARYSKYINGPTEAQIFISSYLSELSAYAMLGQFQKAIQIMPRVKKGMKQHSEQILAWNEFCFFYALCYINFGLRNYAEALLWMNKTLNAWIPDFEINFYTTIRMLNIMIHYELGNFAYLEYAIKSIYRFLLKKDRLYKAEKSLLKYFKTLTKVNSRDKHIEALKELRSSLYVLSEDNHEKALFEFFDFLSWVDSKIENRPLDEVVRERASAKHPKLSLSS